MHIPRWALIAASLWLASCQMRGDVRPASSDIAPPPRFAEATPQTCSAAESHFALGRFITAPLLEEIRERTGARMARTVTVGDVAATAFDEGRLNVDIEPNGRIVGARCG